MESVNKLVMGTIFKSLGVGLVLFGLSLLIITGLGILFGVLKKIFFM